MKYKAVIPIMIAFFIIGISPVHASYKADTRKGIQNMNAKSYSEAVDNFTEALTKQAKKGELYHNLGTAYEKDDQKIAAIEAYKEAIPKLKGKKKEMALLNLGNTYQESQQYDQAILSYIQGLKENPTNHDFKTNLELALITKKKQAQSGNQQAKNKENKEDKQQSDAKKEPQKLGENKEKNNNGAPEKEETIKELKTLYQLVEEQEAAARKKHINQKKKQVTWVENDW